MDYLKIIRQPIERELQDFVQLFNKSLTYGDGMLDEVLGYVRQRVGKLMRPIIILLMAKAYGKVNDVTLYSAVSLELLHTASLMHDDVVDRSKERRGQASVNAIYNNRVSIIVGDYILSTALKTISQTRSYVIIDYLAELCRTLSNGELLQMSSNKDKKISEEAYFEVIRQKTAALFSVCAAVGAISVGASEDDVEKAKKFGENLGMAFQIRDDIFDYYDNAEIGKPTGNDMAEGKLTLPIIYALNSYKLDSLLDIAYKVKECKASTDEINCLVDFAKGHGGIEYAESCMAHYRDEALKFIDETVINDDISTSLRTYVDFVVAREK